MVAEGDQRPAAIAQAAWLVAAVTLVQFAVRRFLSATARRRPPNSFVWIPLSFAMGIAGAVMTAIYALGGEQTTWLLELGRSLVLQGVFIGLVLGVGGLALPLMTRGEAPPDGDATNIDVKRRLAHVAAALLVLVSFLLQSAYSLRAGLAYFAVRSGAPIVPVAVLGSSERPGRLVKALPPLRSRVDVVFGDPFEAGDGSGRRTRKALDEATERIQKQLTEHLENARRLTGR